MSLFQRTTLPSVFASRLALGVACLSASAVLTVPKMAQAGDEANSASCRVNAVLASKGGGGGIPSELSFLKKELSSDQFAAYKSFKLLDAQDYALKLQKLESKAVDSGHKVGLKLLGGELARPRVQVVVEGKNRDRALVSADYTIKSNGFLLLAGFKHPDGKIIFAIQCKGTLLMKMVGDFFI